MRTYRSRGLRPDYSYSPFFAGPIVPRAPVYTHALALETLCSEAVAIEGAGQSHLESPANVSSGLLRVQVGPLSVVVGGSIVAAECRSLSATAVTLSNPLSSLSLFSSPHVCGCRSTIFWYK